MINSSIFRNAFSSYKFEQIVTKAMRISLGAKTSDPTVSHGSNILTTQIFCSKIKFRYNDTLTIWFTCHYTRKGGVHELFLMEFLF